LYSLVVVLGKNEPTTEDRDIAERCLSTLFDVAITEHWASFPRAEFGTKQNFKKIQNFAIPLVILTWNRMLQEYFMKDPEHTFFGLGDYREQKKREKAPYDNIFMSSNDGVEVKVNSFTCFKPNENLASSPVVCPSLLQWAGYLLSPAMETEEHKKERLHKVGEKPMENYNMTHITMKSQSRPTRENTADVVTTPSKELEKSDTTGKSDTTIALQQPGNIAFLATVAEMLTSPNDSAEEEEPTSAELLYRIGEALEAGERTHNSISKKQKPVGFVHNEAMVKEGIASFVQLVKSINKVDGQLDFPAAMDWLGRESKTGKSLIIDLTRPDDNESSSDDSSANSKRSSDDSDYRDGGGDSKPRHKKEISHNKEKNSDEGDFPPDGDVIVETSNDDEDEISVDDSNDSNTNYPDDLFKLLYDKSTHHDDVEDEGVRDGQHQEKSGGLEERQESDKHDEVEDEGVQDGQQHRHKSGGLGERQQSDEDDEVEDEDQDKSGGLEKRQDSDEEQQDHRRGKTGVDTLSKSQRKRLHKKKRGREKRNRDQEEDQEGDHESNRKEEDSAEEVDKRRKKKKTRKKQSSDGI
jgi:hypothetical protein